MKDSFSYQNLSLQKFSIGDTSIGLRQLGSGEHLVFVHGFPTNGYTWRKILPALSERYTCHIVDLPGLGDSEWSAKTNFNIDAQAKKLQQLTKKLSINKYSIIAHNSGGAIARILSQIDAHKVNALILINTEIPDHRPPFITYYQRLGTLPLVPLYIKNKLGQERFVRSSKGFREFYSNRSMFDDKSNLGPYLDPLKNSYHKTKGAFKFLKGIDWKIIDGFKKTHKNIQAKVCLIWGEDDNTFPIHLGRNMAQQFNGYCDFHAISKASLMPHEEKPEEVLEIVQAFLKKSQASKNNGN